MASLLVGPGFAEPERADLKISPCGSRWLRVPGVHATSGLLPPGRDAQAEKNESDDPRAAACVCASETCAGGPFMMLEHASVGDGTGCGQLLPEIRARGVRHRAWALIDEMKRVIEHAIRRRTSGGVLHSDTCSPSFSADSLLRVTERLEVSPIDETCTGVGQNTRTG